MEMDDQPMKNIYVHIGTHKTGTTTIQHALKGNALKNPNEKSFICSNKIAKQFMREEKYNRYLVQRFQDEIQSMIQRSKSANKVVLSNEALSGLPESGYQNSNVVYSMLRDATTKYNVKIIIYLRRQDSFVESLYTQMIHQGDTIEFERFFKQFESPGALNYRRMLNDLRSYFDDQNIIVRSYHEASERGLLIDFSDVIKSKSLKFSKQKEKNPSYSRHALEIAKICNASLDQEGKQQLRAALQATMAKRRNEPFSLFTDDERAKFLDKHKESNLVIANRYFSGNLEKLFPTPNIITSISYKKILTYEEVARLVVHLLHGHESGIIAGGRVALSRYPRLKNLLRKVLQH